MSYDPELGFDDDQLPEPPAAAPLSTCRDCQHEVSQSAVTCPNCGAPYPYKAEWTGYGFEYKSKATICGIPLLHVSFKYRQNRTPVVARGIISIGQFGVGVFNISQFGFGMISISQFTIAGAALAQFCVAAYGVCQIGAIVEGYGQLVYRIPELPF